MASIHPINHSRRLARRERCTVQEIRIMQTMRFSGYNLAEIAKMTDRTVPCVWRHTAFIIHDNCIKGRMSFPAKMGNFTLLFDKARIA